MTIIPEHQLGSRWSKDPNPTAKNTFVLIDPSNFDWHELFAKRYRQPGCVVLLKESRLYNKNLWPGDTWSSRIVGNINKIEEEDIRLMLGGFNLVSPAPQSISGVARKDKRSCCVLCAANPSRDCEECKSLVMVKSPVAPKMSLEDKLVARKGWDIIHQNGTPRYLHMATETIANVYPGGSMNYSYTKPNGGMSSLTKRHDESHEDFLIRCEALIGCLK